MKNFPGAYSELAIPIALFVLVSSARAVETPAAANPASALLPLHVNLSVSPAPSPFPFGSSPKVGDGTLITLTATLPQPVMAASPRATGPTSTTYPQFSVQYSFTAVLLPTGQTFVLQNDANQAKWTPPKGGDYNFNVVVRRGPAEGSAAVNNFHVRPSFVFFTAKISANPPVMSLPDAFTISATVPPLPPHLAGVGAMMNRFWFSSVQQFVYPPSPQTWQSPISTGNTSAAWKPNPHLAHGLYAILVYMQTFMNNVLIAEGFGTTSTSPADFYRGYYTVLLPSGPCPTPTPTADPTQPFGWLTPITTQNSSGQSVATRQGSANCAIAGYSINDIANNPQLRVRTINVSCSNCHIGMMAGNVGRNWFCNVLPLGFVHTQPPDNEATLYNLLANWKSRGCPD
jgi:hypothetical protein